ncbi:MAG: cation:proton antiporter, partial [Bacteroidales bacterium]|nr:cation:proton antiporter [Bacteroidales bacterium]
MNEELNLVRDLAVILVSAGLFTIISKALKQPLILGYIIAGFIIGPHLQLIPFAISEETVHEWSDIGIIFLMFGLGLEFSFKKLLKVGSSALVSAGSKFFGVFVIGYIAGQAMGWSTMESVFLGGLLSMSSTMVVLKSYDDMGLKKKPYAGMVFGTLVVEDLIAILLMVLLSTMAVSNKFEGKEMLFNLAKLAFFLILWFLVGIYIIPTLFKKARKYLNDEILLIVSIGLCFGMVALAEGVGFSSALGAFVIGSILAETIESEHIEHLVSPIKDLFGAIFFVSVGMMVAPDVIAAHWRTILIITVIVMVTHIIFVSAGILMTGKGLRNAVHAGFSLAQLGEFGFIIAGVGVSLGVMRGFIYPVIIAVSVVTTFTTPYMIKLATPAYKILCRVLPSGWVARMDQQGGGAGASVAEKSEWRKLLSAYFIRIVLYGVILIAIFIGSKLYLGNLIKLIVPDIGQRMLSIFEVVITIVAMTPFLIGLGVNTGSINASANKLLKEKSSNLWPIAGLVIARTFIAISFIISVIASHFYLAWWTIALIVAAGFALIISARRTMRHFSAIESRF